MDAFGTDFYHIDEKGDTTTVSKCLANHMINVASLQSVTNLTVETHLPDIRIC